MENEFLDPPLSQGLSHHINFPAQPMSGPLSQAPMSVAAVPEKVDSNRARKVAEVFLTAGHAFQKLGDLTMQLHMGYSLPTEEKWSENDVEQLREALTRFAHELDQISNNIQAKTTKMIGTDIRRGHTVPQRTVVASNVSTLKRQPAKLGPIVVSKRPNMTRNSMRYIPTNLAATPTTVSQIVVPSTKTYPLTRVSTSTSIGQRQYVMSVPQAGPSRSMSFTTPHTSNQTAVHQQNTTAVSHHGATTHLPAMDVASPLSGQGI